MRALWIIVFAIALGCPGKDAELPDASGAPVDGSVLDVPLPENPDGDDVTAPPPDLPPDEPGSPTWDWLLPLPECDVLGGAPLLDAALALTGLTQATFTFSPFDLEQSAYHQAGHLADPFLLGWFEAARGAPAEAGCFVRSRATVLDTILAGPHPVAGAIRHAAGLAERWEEGDPLDPGLNEGDTLSAAMVAACAAAGHELPPPDLALPASLDAALAPIFRAMADGLAAHAAMDAGQKVMSAQAWIANGSTGMAVFGNISLLAAPTSRAYFLGHAGRPALNLAAARIAYAVESVDWSSLVGVEAALLLQTPLGLVRIGGPSDDTYAASSGPVWFHLDTGGQDTYRGAIGANTHGHVGVNLAIDLAGNDDYGYDPVVSPLDQDWLLPADADGRLTPNEQYGPVTLSKTARQGAGRNGIGMLFDLGGGDDSYRSLAMSQGYAHLGVGVLFDDGGNDTYRAEASSQGAAAYGIGLLIDAGDGKDLYESINRSQGSAGVGGVGILHDAGGNDSYSVDVGHPDFGGHPIYYSPQMPTNGNTSMSQGAATGLRWDTGLTFLSGGIGILRDVSGDDTYLASVFAQGTGYWQGTGILSDGDGADTYDALWYVQGGAAHYAIGMLFDGGDGSDAFNTNLATRSVQLGSGHDYSLGVFVNELGSDTYVFQSLAMGASNCNGIGLAIDNGGDDDYQTGTDYNTGLGNVSDECLAARPDAVSIGIMIDAAGSDTYTYPESPHPVPSDGASFGHVTHDLPSEHGAGLDKAGGETGIHAQ